MDRIVASEGYEPTKAEQLHDSVSPVYRHSQQLFKGNRVARDLNGFDPSSHAPVISVRKNGFYFHTSDGKSIFLDTSLRGALTIARYIEATGRSPLSDEREVLKQEANADHRLEGIAEISAREVYEQNRARA